MTIQATTTATELLKSGASILSRHGQTLSELLQISTTDDRWMNDLSVEDLLERGAAITLMNGLGLLKLKNRLVMFEEQFDEIQTLSDYPMSEMGLVSALDDLAMFSETEGLAAAA